MFYLLNKEKGISSFKAINDFAHKNNINKIGHSGTLDPLASGLLLVATDDDTRMISYIKHTNKTYLATIIFGAQTDTYDVLGKKINASKNKVKESQIEDIKNWFLKQKQQVPPLYSAKKINGVKGYELARKGKTSELKPMPINVFSANIKSFDYEKQKLVVELKVSYGTYIRSLINDLGLYLKTYAYMLDLQRSAIGELELNTLGNKKELKIAYKKLFDRKQFLSFTKQEMHYLLTSKTVNKNVKDGLYFALNLEASEDNQICGIVIVDKKIVKVKKLFGKRIGNQND